MTGKITLVERGDVFEARELKDLAESRAFNVYARRIDRMIEDQRSACESAQTFEQLKEAQGALKVLKTVRQLPAILIREMASTPGHRSK